MQDIEVGSWADYKTLVSNKKLLMQYEQVGSRYRIFSPEADSFMWITTLVKGTEEATDFETNFKATANQPLEVKGEAGKPMRFSPTSQPNNTVEKWKGFHLEIPAEDSTATMDIQFDANVYLRGGCIYSSDCSVDDHLTASVVLKANPSYVIIADLLKDVYMAPGLMIPFLSAECMSLPSTAMLRVTYTKADTTSDRNISAIADFYAQ